MFTKKLQDKVTKLPEAPGVYIFKDAGGAILYIGKAKSLKKRVQSYFSRDLAMKTQAMIARVSDIEYRPTSSESQAQILEASLIKEHLPQYNISLKDDKSFPWIKISNEEFPLVTISRRKKRDPADTATYFGPYTNVELLRQAFKVMRKIFGFRTCKTLSRKACLYYRLLLCPAPCIAKISRQRYNQLIQEIKLFLDSRYEDLIAQLGKRMNEAVKLRRFEEAARLRDQIAALGAIGNAPGSQAILNELEDLRQFLKLDKTPQRIEAFDISNIQGTSPCGSMVSFYKGQPDKNNYRRFRIRTVAGIDDYRMLAEVVERRYRRVIEEGLVRPDLILIDGGRQHLLTAQRQLQALHLDIPLASIAKDRENIYVSGNDQPLHLTSDTPALNLIRRVRDEAHRFAVSYHRLLRKKKTIGIEA